MSTATAAKPVRAIARRRGSMMWVQGLACGTLLTFATPTALLLGCLFAPAILYALASPGAERGVLRAVASSCAATSLGPAWHLWMGGGEMAQLAVVLSKPSTLCLAWGGGAAAWALCQVLPVVLQGAMNGREAAKVRLLKAELDTITEEWGLSEDEA